MPLFLLGKKDMAQPHKTTQFADLMARFEVVARMFMKISHEDLL
jgi:hypothetical protein